MLGERGATGSTDGGRSVARWFLLTGSRRTVTATLLGGVFVGLVVLPTVTTVNLRFLLTDAATVRLLDTLLSGTILLVSIVVSVASLVVSQELSPVGRQEQRIQETTEFRRRAEDLMEDGVSPARPADFLRAITQSILHRTQRLDDVVSDRQGHPGLDEAVSGNPVAEVEAYLEAVAAETERVNRALTNSDLDSFETLLAALEYDYSSQLHVLRRLRTRRERSLPEEAESVVDELIDALRYFATAREYFKSLYFEREFADLSRDLLYVSIPTILVLSYVVLAVDVQSRSGTVFGVQTPLLVVGTAYTVALAPFMTLTAYVLRVATVARRTLSAGPFRLEESRREWHVDAPTTGDE